MSGEICTDNRFAIIAAYKRDLLDCTNIETSPDEMAVIDNVLFRFWQMGWLKEMPQTNSDRIRQMTDEELAYFHVGMGCPPGIDVYEKCHDIGAVPPVCLKCWLEWLKSPVEVDNGT